ncbi:MAG: hypothetical protein DSY80_05440 [Desulfocapsa sp.]|nr:MAG: hypothetical protein DSY80_05440 [Desulfocapsa sp.]
MILKIKSLHQDLRQEEKELNTLSLAYASLRESQEENIKALKILQQAAKLAQAQTAAKLSGIVTKAIRAVLNKPYEFHLEFVERRGATECDIFVTLHGNRASILGATGGGLADVCSLALKVAYLLLSKNDRVLFLDECSRHVNSPRQRRLFATVIKTLSQEFEIQFIIASAIPELIEIADNLITVTQTNEVSHVVVTPNPGSN